MSGKEGNAVIINKWGFEYSCYCNPEAPRELITGIGAREYFLAGCVDIDEITQYAKYLGKCYKDEEIFGETEEALNKLDELISSSSRLKQCEIPSETVLSGKVEEDGFSFTIEEKEFNCKCPPGKLLLVSRETVIDMYGALELCKTYYLLL